MAIEPYMESGTYPHIRAGWKTRLKICWRILWHGDMFPQPLPWYESVYRLVESPYGHCAKRAVEKSEREFPHTKATRALRLQEALQWFHVYVKESKLNPIIHPWVPSFLIEWWVLQINRRL